MIKTSILLFLLPLLYQVNTQQPESPCPRLFVYETPTKPEPDRWYGIITLLSETDLNGVWLRIIFDKPALQLGNWFGEVVGRENNKDFLVKNRTAHLTANVPQTVKFYVKYDPNETPPRLTGFRLNAVQMCPEGLQEGTTPKMELQTSNVITSITSKPAPVTSKPESASSGNGNNVNFVSSSNGNENTKPIVSKPPPSVNNNVVNTGSNAGGFSSGGGNNEGGFSSGGGSNPEIFSSGSGSQGSAGFSGNNSDNSEIFVKPGGGFNLGSSQFGNEDEFFPGDYSFFNESQHPSKQTVPLNDICGTTVPPRSGKTQSQSTTEGEYPWHVAIYRTKGINLAYWCGGTLISRVYVITAAHCVTKWKMQLPQDTDNFVVYLGKYHLNRFTSGSQERLIQEIIPHPKYDPKILCNDIALVKLATPVDITDFVRPVCLWKESTDLNLIVKQAGSVVGWATDEYGRLTHQLTEAKMPVASVEMCAYALPTFYPLFATNTTYCASFLQGTAVCNGDSGGGMVFPRRIPNQNKIIWELRGLVSFSVDLNNHFRCGQSHYVVFTDTAKYLDWINKYVRE